MACLNTCVSAACLRLSIEPIPESSRLASLANLLPPWQWDRVRRSVYQRAGYRCQACGREGMLHCHEVWQYNEQTSTQWLRGFAALCKDCHDTKHILFHSGTARYQELISHFIAVNRISQEEAEQYLEAVRQLQQRLNQRQWTVNYGSYNSCMPALASQQQRKSYVRLNRPAYRHSLHPQRQAQEQIISARRPLRGHFTSTPETQVCVPVLRVFRNQPQTKLVRRN